jgi:hypothetical protein
MIKHRDSHVDHGLTNDQIGYLLERFADRRTFFLETVELPGELGTVSCALWGSSHGRSTCHGRRGRPRPARHSSLDISPHRETGETDAPGHRGRWTARRAYLRALHRVWRAAGTAGAR